MIHDNASDVEPEVPTDSTPLAIFRGELDSLARSYAERRVLLRPCDLDQALTKLGGWPFGPDDERAAVLVEWLAATFVCELVTDAIEREIVERLKSSARQAARRLVSGKYDIPYFDGRSPMPLFLPPRPRSIDYGDDELETYSEDLRRWHAEFDPKAAEHAQAVAAYEAEKASHQATWAPVENRRRAEIEAVDSSPFPCAEWERLVSAAFAERAVERYREENEEPEYTEYAPPIVVGFLRPAEPGVIGARQKTGKTLLGVELAAALATGTPFLGMAIPKPVGVWVLTKETPAAYWRDLFVRAVRSRGHDPKKALARLMLTTDIEATRDRKKRAELTSYLLRSGTKVAILDPLYKIRSECSSADLTAEGAVLDELALPFTEAGCCPVLVHHFTKHTPTGQWPALEDLSGAAVGPFARSWCLLNRRTEYAGDGRHELLALTGSSAGDFGRLRIDLDERDWSVAILGDPAAQPARRPGPAFLAQAGLAKAARRPARKG